ncbi:hypothetical protein D5R81_15020 [Parashewanella spongiae]|uniref:DUF1795 domain-containing protein n=1 Tax=Parashewanella spongiae TaxID=342950 RepID=A0A3A6TJU2_9GAMM|nr:hypothetical protein [Parashewanella spongiae]MCL1079231.1 hypothetical protein [Parashewanella spongiae]RJY07883.1 hypothetical protein D5R81_15020 [Parashewanella spongiae]
MTVQLGFNQRTSAFLISFILLSIALFSLPAKAKQADSPSVITLDIFSQPVSFNIPQNWKQTREDQLADMYSAEFIPNNEKMSQWSELICIQGFKNISDDLTSETFLESLASTYKEHCNGEVVFESLGDIKVNNYSGSHGLIGCTRMPNIHTISIGRPQQFVSKPQGEMGYYTALTRDSQVILLHKSMRGKVFSPNLPPLTKDNYATFVHTLFSRK